MSGGGVPGIPGASRGLRRWAQMTIVRAHLNLYLLLVCEWLQRNRKGEGPRCGVSGPTQAQWWGHCSRTSLWEGQEMQTGK